MLALGDSFSCPVSARAHVAIFSPVQYSELMRCIIYVPKGNRMPRA